MSPSTAETVHPDFADSADVTLVSSDGVKFNIDSAILSRSSGFFRGMFTLPQGASQHQSIAIAEDASVLAVLLKLASGMASAELDELASFGAVERLLSAADKYDMPGATQVLRLVLRVQLSGRTPPGQSPFVRYAIACKYGFADLADELAETCASIALDWDDVPTMSGDHLARIMRLRQARVSTFHQQIRAKTDGPLVRENSGRCPCGHSDHELESYELAMWKSFIAEACVQFAHTPSIDAVLSHTNVQGMVRKMQYITCTSSSPGRASRFGYATYAAYIWSDIHSRMRQACAPPTTSAGSPPIELS